MPQGNKARSWLGRTSGGVCYEVTSEMTGTDYTYKQTQSDTQAQNTGVKTKNFGALDPNIKLEGYRQHTAGSVHRLLSGATDVEWVYSEVCSETASDVAVGDIGRCFIGTRQEYPLPQNHANPMMFNVPLVSRGIRVPPFPYLLYLNEATKTATNVDGSEYDEGAASVGLAYGGLAICNIYGVTGTDTYDITVQSATSSGGAFSTLATFSGVGNALGGFYSVVAVATTINRYKKVNIALASGTGLTETFKVSIMFAPFYNL